MAPHEESCIRGSCLLCSSLIKLFRTSAEIVFTNSQCTKFPQKVKIDNFGSKLTNLCRPDLHALFTAEDNTREDCLLFVRDRVSLVATQSDKVMDSRLLNLQVHGLPR